MPLPPDHVGLIVADTRRAIAWEEGLRDAGLAPLRVEASGRDAELGDWQIGVPRAQKSAGQAFVSEVTRGDRRLPSRPFVPPVARRALLGVLAVIAAGAVVAVIRALAG